MLLRRGLRFGLLSPNFFAQALVGTSCLRRSRWRVFMRDIRVMQVLSFKESRACLDDPSRLFCAALSTEGSPK